MSKKCQGFCNRTYEEYYEVDSRILCANCWEKELDDLRYKLREIDSKEQQKAIETNRLNQQMGIEFHKMQQQHGMKHTNIYIQIKYLNDEIRIKKQNREWYAYTSSEDAPKPFNYDEVQILESKIRKLEEEERILYRTSPKLSHLKPSATNSFDFFSERSLAQSQLNQLKNARYYTPTEAKIKEQREIEEEKWKREEEARERRREEEAQEQKRKEQKIIAEAKELLQKAKQQKQNEYYAKWIQGKIAEIELLVHKETLSDSLEAIEMLKQQYNWKLNEKEIFGASISNFDLDKVLFEAKRKESIVKAKADLLATKQSITKDKNGQTKNAISKIEELIKSETFKDSEEAIRLLTQKYTWKTNTGKDFSASLSDFDSNLTKSEETERKAEQRKQEAERLAEQKRQEVERKNQEAEQRRQESERKKREEAERIQRRKDERAIKKFFLVILTLAIIGLMIASFSGGYFLGGLLLGYIGFFVGIKALYY